MNILLVDDSRAVRNLYKHVLQQLGHTDFVEAEDGDQAFARFKERVPDLILIDWDMPNMDGLTLIKKIRDANKTIPLIMCSAEVEKARILEAYKAGVNNYIVKPFTPKSLGEKIKQTMAKVGIEDF